MRNRGRLNLMLLAVALVLGGVLAAGQFLNAPAKAPVATNLTDLKREDVSHIRILQLEAPEIELRRNGSDWRLLQPVQAAAEASEVAPLLRLAEAPSHRQFGAGEVEPEQTGLEIPQWTVHMNGQKLEMGDNSALGNQRYVRVGEQIHLIDEPNTHALDPDYAHFIARRLLHEDARIERLQLPGADIRRNPDGVLQLSPARKDVRGDDLAHTVSAWGRARGLWLSRAKSPPDTHLGTLRITLADQSLREFLIVAREPQLMLYSAELGATYHLAAHQAPPLLDLVHPESARQAAPQLKPKPDVLIPESASP